MNQEQRRTIRKNLDFTMAIIRTLAALVSILFNIYIYYKVMVRR